MADIIKTEITSLSAEGAVEPEISDFVDTSAIAGCLPLGILVAVSPLQI